MLRLRRHIQHQVDCPGCMMQISGGLDARDLDVEVKHTATIIAEKRGLM